MRQVNDKESCMKRAMRLLTCKVCGKYIRRDADGGATYSDAVWASQTHTKCQEGAAR